MAGSFERRIVPSLSLSLTIPAGDYPGSVTLSSIGDGVRITKALDKRLIFSIPLVFHERNKIGITGVFFLGGDSL